MSTKWNKNCCDFVLKMYALQCILSRKLVKKKVCSFLCNQSTKYGGIYYLINLKKKRFCELKIFSRIGHFLNTLWNVLTSFSRSCLYTRPQIENQFQFFIRQVLQNIVSVQSWNLKCSQMNPLLPLRYITNITPNCICKNRWHCNSKLFWNL